jgi:hypothetical protein
LKGKPSIVSIKQITSDVTCHKLLQISEISGESQVTEGLSEMIPDNPKKAKESIFILQCSSCSIEEYFSCIFYGV